MRTWWVDPGRVIGGRYPGTVDPAESRQMLARLLDVGVRTVVNLQEPDERGAGDRPFADYGPPLRQIAADRGITVAVHRFPIPDMGVATTDRMAAALAAVDAGLAVGGMVYVHCWGGHGRTGTVAGCYLVRSGQPFDAVMETIDKARRHDPHLRTYPAPQTPEQRRFVRDWPRTSA